MCWWQISGTFFGAYFNTAGLWTPSCNHPLYFHIEFSVLDTLTKIIRWMYTVNLEHHKHSFCISPWKAGGCDGRKRFAFWDEAVTVWTVPITTSGSHLKLKHVTCCKRAAYLCQCGSWSVRTIWWSCSVFRAVWCHRWVLEWRPSCWPSSSYICSPMLARPWSFAWREASPSKAVVSAVLSLLMKVWSCALQAEHLK